MHQELMWLIQGQEHFTRFREDTGKIVHKVPLQRRGDADDRSDNEDRIPCCSGASGHHSFGRAGDCFLMSEFIFLSHKDNS